MRGEEAAGGWRDDHQLPLALDRAGSSVVSQANNPRLTMLTLCSGEVRQDRAWLFVKINLC